MKEENMNIGNEQSKGEVVFQRVVDTVMIIGAYNRCDITSKSLLSLKTLLHAQDLRVIVVDSSINTELYKICLELGFSYIWLPGDVGMASARDIAYQYAKHKYVFDWVIFAEDDLEYHPTWYQVLLNRAKALYGKTSPNGLVYSVFSAAPGIKSDETVVFDEKNDCYAQFFGPRADQRLFKVSHYEAVIKHWDPDILGVSSSQAGSMIQRNALRGFCSANIKHLNLCREVEGQESTWDGIRDIGPAAFDKRMNGYEVIVERVKQLSGERSQATDQVAMIPQKSLFAMTEVKFDEKPSIKKRIRKLLRK